MMILDHGDFDETPPRGMPGDEPRKRNREERFYGMVLWSIIGTSAGMVLWGFVETIRAVWR